MEPVDVPRQEELLETDNLPLSIVLPTYNESQNIASMLDSIAGTLSADAHGEIIVVDDNSPDGTGDIAIEHAKKFSNKKLRIQVIRRPDLAGQIRRLVQRLLE